MADEEIEELKREKKKLIDKLTKLRDNLRAEGTLPRGVRNVTLNDSHRKTFDEPVNKTDDAQSSEKTIARLCNVSQSILGVQFEDIDRNWILENIYRYDARVVTKAFQFVLELTVNIESHEKHEIMDIKCHFIDLDKCFIEEIAPWTLRFTQEKNFSQLISAVSDYSEKSTARTKILRALESKRYVSVEKCNETGGGILIYVHPPEIDEKILFKFWWYTKFIDRTWRIEHIFSIDPIQADEKFIEDNHDLLEGFCKVGLGKLELENLWSNLCTVIDTVV